MQPWHQLMQFKIVPLLKVLKHSATQHTHPTIAPPTITHSAAPSAGGSTAASLREQLAVSELQITETPALKHTRALEARNRELEHELAALESEYRQSQAALETQTTLQESNSAVFEQKHEQLRALEAERRALEAEVELLESKKRAGGRSDSSGTRVEAECEQVCVQCAVCVVMLWQLHAKCKEQQMKIDELLMTVSRFEQTHGNHWALLWQLIGVQQTQWLSLSVKWPKDTP